MPDYPINDPDNVDHKLKVLIYSHPNFDVVCNEKSMISIIFGNRLSSNSTKVVHFIKGSNFVPLILRYGQVSETTCFSKDRITFLSGYAIGKQTILSTRTQGDNVAPTLKPYREHKARGIICDQSLG